MGIYAIIFRVIIFGRRGFFRFLGYFILAILFRYSWYLRIYLAPVLVFLGFPVGLKQFNPRDNQI